MVEGATGKGTGARLPHVAARSSPWLNVRKRRRQCVEGATGKGTGARLLARRLALIVNAVVEDDGANC